MKKIILIICVIVISCSRSNETIKITNYYDDAQKQKSEEYYVLKANLAIKHGLHIGYWMNGKIMNKTNYVNGIRQGESTEYLENGKLVIRKFFKDGKFDSLLTSYFDDGKIEYVYKYQNGKLLEVVEMNDRLGNKLDYGTFKNGNGILYNYSFFDEIKEVNIDTGRVIYQIPYVNGIAEGEGLVFFYTSPNTVDTITRTYRSGDMLGS